MVKFKHITDLILRKDSCQNATLNLPFETDRALLTKEEYRKGVILTWCYVCKGSTKHQTVDAHGKPVRPRLTYFMYPPYRQHRHHVCLRCNPKLAKKQHVSLQLPLGVDILT